MAKKFRDLSEREILALAISLEEEDARVYADYADGLRDSYPDTAKIFDEMRAEETEHRNSLMETYTSRFGEHIPLIRRQDVTGFVQRRPLWLARPLRIADVRKQVEVMEYETRRFYERALQHVSDIGIRKLLAGTASAVSFSQLVEKTAGMAPADMEAIVQAAQRFAFGRSDRDDRLPRPDYVGDCRMFPRDANRSRR